MSSVKDFFLNLVSEKTYKRKVTENDLTEVDRAVLNELLEREKSAKRKEQEMLRHATKASPIGVDFKASKKPSRHKHQSRATHASAKRPRSASNESKSPLKKYTRYNHPRESLSSSLTKRKRSVNDESDSPMKKYARYNHPRESLSSGLKKRKINETPSRSNKKSKNNDESPMTQLSSRFFKMVI